MKTFRLLEAPNSRSGGISFHLSILRQRLSPENKIFWLGDSEFLPPAFQELPQSKVHAATDSQYPVLAAAAYVVAALYTWPVNPFEDNSPDFSNQEYDPLNYFNREKYKISLTIFR